MERARKKCTSQLKVVPEDERTCNILQIFVTADCDGTPGRIMPPSCGMRSSLKQGTTCNTSHLCNSQSYWSPTFLKIVPKVSTVVVSQQFALITSLG
jgi:hypothetical protein